MPIIKREGKPLLQSDDFVERVKLGQVLPLISHEGIDDLVLGGHQRLVETFAELSGYPLPYRDDLPKMARYWAIQQEKDDWGLKSFYLDVVKTYLVDLARERGRDEEQLAEAEAQADTKSASEFAALLDLPDFEAVQHPLMVLANLPVPIFVTTSSHRFLEAALVKAGRKTVHTDYLRWHGGLPDVRDSELAKGWRPSGDEPLVYHLFGLDEHPGSLVLTEDDYLRVLIALSGEKARETDILPNKITEALNTSTLVLLGFPLRSWAFRVVFWGLIKNSANRNLGKINLVMQSCVEEQEPVQPHCPRAAECRELAHHVCSEEQGYVQAYLRQEARLEVSWGDVAQWADDVRKKWRSG